MKQAGIYSICGEHTAFVRGPDGEDIELAWTSDDMHASTLQAGAMGSIAFLEKTLKKHDITHVVDIIDDDWAESDKFEELHVFFTEWRKFVRKEVP
jgi:hypothetical protein